MVALFVKNNDGLGRTGFCRKQERLVINRLVFQILPLGRIRGRRRLLPAEHGLIFGIKLKRRRRYGHTGSRPDAQVAVNHYLADADRLWESALIFHVVHSIQYTFRDQRKESSLTFDYGCLAAAYLGFTLGCAIMRVFQELQPHERWRFGWADVGAAVIMFLTPLPALILASIAWRKWLRTRWRTSAGTQPG